MNTSPPTENCYQLTPASEAESRCLEFASPTFERWLDRLCEQGFCQLLVSLILKLERLIQAPLDGPQRVLLLRELMTLIHDVADDLPTCAPLRPGARGAPPLSLAQRLICVTFRNLKRTLEDLDRGGGVVGERDGGRFWVVAQMYDWLGRQIELGAGWGKTWPEHTWQELHDLSAYSSNRIGVGWPAGEGVVEPGAGIDRLFDPESTYKRLLMVGLCAEQDAGALLVAVHSELFAQWVKAAELQDPGSYFGVLGAYLVETSGDAPPRLVPGALGPVNMARVLRLPKGFLAALAAVKAGRHPFAVE